MKCKCFKKYFAHSKNILFIQKIKCHSIHTYFKQNIIHSSGKSTTHIRFIHLSFFSYAEHETVWNAILEDKISRNNRGPMMSYFMKLRNHYQNQNNIVIDDPSLADEVFLNSEDIIKVATKLQNSSSLNSTVLVQTSQNNNNSSSNCSTSANNAISPSSSISSVEFEFSRQNTKTAARGMCSTPLPINLSTLLPVSRNNLQDVNSAKEMPLTTWLQGGSTMLTIPGLSSLLSSSSAPISPNNAGGAISPASSSTSLSIPNEQVTNKITNSGGVIPWPGIEAIADSYRKYSQGKTKYTVVGPRLSGPQLL